MVWVLSVFTKQGKYPKQFFPETKKLPHPVWTVATIYQVFAKCPSLCLHGLSHIILEKTLERDTVIITTLQLRKKGEQTLSTGPNLTWLVKWQNWDLNLNSGFLDSKANILNSRLGPKPTAQEVWHIVKRRMAHNSGLWGILQYW